MGAAFYRGAEACILVYDITNAGSFDHLATWKQNFLDKALPKDPANFRFFVFGNKKDKENERQVSQQQAKDWIKKSGSLPWEETSALDSLCIEKAFDKIANSMLRNSLKPSIR